MKNLNIRDVKENLVKMIADDWALVSAGTADDWNTMTISWGAIGELWGKDVVIAFIRPQRHTKKYLDESDYFTVSFLDDKNKLKICGTKSGKDCDKIALAELKAETDGDAVYPDEATTVIKCRKLSCQQMDPKSFIDPDIENNYAQKDYHWVYVGEIEKVLVK